MNISRIAIASMVTLSSISGIGAAWYGLKSSEKLYDTLIEQDINYNDEELQEAFSEADSRMCTAEYLFAFNLLTAAGTLLVADKFRKRGK